MDAQSSPPIISHLGLANFRGFKRTGEIRLAPLTFLVGPNSSGKSSLADSIMLVAQSGFLPLSEQSFVPRWIGSLVDLGSFRDTVFAHRKNLSIRIAFRLSGLYSDPFETVSRLNDVSIIWEIKATTKSDIGYVASLQVGMAGTDANVAIEFTPRKLGSYVLRAGAKKVVLKLEATHRFEFADIAEREFRRLDRRFDARAQNSPWKQLRDFWDSGALVYFISQTERVSSARSAPLRWYPLASPLVNDRYLGFEPGLIDRIEPAMLSSRPPRNPFMAARLRGKSKSIDDVLAELDIAKSAAKEELSAYHSAIHLEDSVTGVVSNLADIGYGASQVMPVAAGCASNRIGPLFVEQPEVHLHPKAQAKIAELLAQASLQRQVIVETHSEHLINRARIMVAEGALPTGHVSIVYVARDGGGSRITPIGLDEHGEFTTPWPDGFFDERYQDTMKLLKLRTRTGGKKNAGRSR